MVPVSPSSVSPYVELSMSLLNSARKISACSEGAKEHDCGKSTATPHLCSGWLVGGFARLGMV